MLRALIADRIRTNGPISVAEYMELALYHPSYGYYARESVRTGRAGDFFTSVDVGPLFGELLARQFADMWDALTPQPSIMHLVEAGAGSGRLSRDVLAAAATSYPAFYDAVRLHLVERAPAARAAQIDTLGPHAPKLASSEATLPDSIEGVVFANELLDAMPTHVVVMREDGLREVFVDLEDDGPGDARFVEREQAPSTPELGRYLARADVRLQPGWRVEINLEAVSWIQQAARALDRGFLLLFDYGHPADQLYSAAHSGGTLATFRRHVSRNGTEYLTDPGEADMTAHVDLTTVRRAAEAEGLVTLGTLDQTYFVLGLGSTRSDDLKGRLAFKTLVWPGGLGSVLKVLIFGKGVGRPRLQGLSFGQRLT